jgi:hypothetical protein
LTPSDEVRCHGCGARWLPAAVQSYRGDDNAVITRFGWHV